MKFIVSQLFSDLELKNPPQILTHNGSGLHYNRSIIKMNENFFELECRY